MKRSCQGRGFPFKHLRARPADQARPANQARPAEQERPADQARPTEGRKSISAATKSDSSAGRGAWFCGVAGVYPRFLPLPPARFRRAGCRLPGQ